MQIFDVYGFVRVQLCSALKDPNHFLARHTEAKLTNCLFEPTRREQFPSYAAR